MNNSIPLLFLSRSLLSATDHVSILIYMLKKINEWKDRFSVPTFTWLEWTRNSHFETLNLLDRCQHLSKCASTPPLIQQQSSDNYLGLNLGKGRGRYVVAQMLTCHWSKLFMAAQNIIGCDFTVKNHSSLPFGSSSFTIKVVVVECILIFFLLRKRRRRKQARKRNWNSQPWLVFRSKLKCRHHWSDQPPVAYSTTTPCQEPSTKTNALNFFTKRRNSKEILKTFSHILVNFPPTQS